jgi:cell division septum initiation protein DivIVA
MPAEPDRRLGGQYEFTVVRRGYRPAQVDQALVELRAHADTLVADRDGLSQRNQQLAAYLASAIRRANTLEARVKHLSASAASADGLSERVRVILELASAEADAMKTEARELLEQTKASHAQLRHRLAQLDAEQSQILAAARTDADRLTRQAHIMASAHRANADTEAERILEDARTTATNVVADAHRAAAADVDRLREYLLEELPRGLNAVINEAIGQLPHTIDANSIISDPADAVVLPKQRQPQTGPLQAVPD